MKKFIIVVLVSLQAVWVFGQNPEIKTDLPTVIPPSPTVAALMKFEEIPVSNYTGVPDVSIPLFSTGTRSKDINLDISLKYHPAGIAAEERASDVGLGWSLFAGGTISRSVRGLPDEIYDTQGIFNGTGNIGIYQTTGNYKNNYNEVLGFILNGVNSSADIETSNKFLWDTAERGIYDTEYDMWQFNFMGKSGSFIIKKNTTTNLLEVSNIDITSTIKVINHYDTSTYKPSFFEIFDDKGYKYVFDIKEETTSNNVTTVYDFGSNPSPITTVSKDKKYLSAFHLSKIYDTNNKLLVDLLYQENANIEMISDYSTVDDIPLSSTFTDDVAFFENNFEPNQVQRIAKKSVNTISTQRIQTKKLKQIDVQGICKIEFNFLKGRLDSNFFRGDSSYVFKGVQVKDWNNLPVKKTSLEHSYNTTTKTRLFLKAVHTENFQNSKKESYGFEYRELLSSMDGTITKDFFGYFNLRPTLETEGSQFYREVNPYICTLESLQKMVLPTGGCVIFDFESNTYSYDGDNLLTNFDENIDNWDGQLATKAFTTLTSTPANFFTLTEKQDVIFTSTVTSANTNYSDYWFNIYRVDNNTQTYVGAINFSTCLSSECYLKLYNLEPGQYKVSFTSVDLDFPTSFNALINAHYKTKNNLNLKYNYGGGIRIKRIGQFESSQIPKSYYQNLNNTIFPSREKSFNYQLFSNPELSSGALVTGKPIYSYDFLSATFLDRRTTTLICLGSVTTAYPFKKMSDVSNLKAIKTGGADTGYKNVKVEEKNNGYLQYTYTSPIDFPEQRNNFYPFLPHYNTDYKRGLLLNEVSYDNSSKKVTETSQNYSFAEEDNLKTIYGINLSQAYNLGSGNAQGTLHNNPFSWIFTDYASYKDAYTKFENCAQWCYFSILTCGNRPDMLLPNSYVVTNLLYTANGWAKLNSKTNKNYFYTGSTPNVVESTETYTYNALNKRIASQTTTNSNTSEVLKSDFTYHTGNSAFSQNRISEIEKVETYRNTDLLSSTKIIYSTTFAGNVSQLPQTVQTATTSQPFENRLKYNAYDEFGNPLEVQQEGGVSIVYIWGYNKTQPIAKIENATYAAIQSQVANLQNLSNTGTEANLLTALDSLRTSLPTAMVTTYTYKPLIGISTMTDPKGYKMTYEYDEFNRLKQVKDQDGNVLSENQYNYKQ